MKKHDLSSLITAINRIDEMSVQDMPPPATAQENYGLQEAVLVIKKLLSKIDLLEDQLNTRPIPFVPTMESRLGNYIDKGQKGQH